MKFAYTRRGGPLLDWSGPTPPSPTRAGETRSLGSLGGSLDVPRPGAPEIISGYESPHPNAALIHFGADAPTKFDTGLIRKAAVLASAYHGVKRNNGSVLWGLLWVLGAYVAPIYGVSAVGIAVAQGFGQPRFRSNPVRARGSSPWAGVEIGGMMPYSRSKRKIVRRKRRRKARPARKRRQKTLRGVGPYALRRPRPTMAARTRR